MVEKRKVLLPENILPRESAFIDNKRANTDTVIMAQMSVSIPDKLKAWVETRVADGSYASSSDYVRDLLRMDQRNQEKLERLRVEIQAGIDSAISDKDPFEHIAELGERLKSRDAKSSLTDNSL